MSSNTDDRSSLAHETGPSEGERPVSDPSGGASIDKVREILFGTQVREFERRFARIEERIVKETSDLKALLTGRLEALEALTRKEIESLADQIKAEHEDRVESHGGVARELKAATSTLERRLSALDEQLAKSQREIRQQILDLDQRLSDDVRGKMDEVLATLAREAQELRSDKADRATIAALFTEMAMRLTDDFPGSGSDDTRDG